VAPIVKPLLGRAITDVQDLLRRVRKLEALGSAVTVYPDAEEWIEHILFEQRMAAQVVQIRKNPKAHPLRTTLLKAELLPYQLDGIAFAAGAGRAILADDMGLGKTVQGIGVAELLSRETQIRKVLVICPTSLKSQWRNEIHRFSDRDCQLIIGGAAERARQYDNGCFFTICNYEQALRDVLAIERTTWDLIILDEGQRIKNWEAKTSRTIKALRSRFALVLSGTPLENRLDELFSVAEFIDDRRLGPAFRFFNQHRVVDEKGKVLGYKNLAELRRRLAPILLRRTRASVMSELPPRNTEIVRIPPTAEQLGVHRAHMHIVNQIVNKKFITEMDLLRLQKALLMARMVADSTTLVDKEQPGYSSKLERLDELLDQLISEKDRKILLFSEWTSMLNLIEPLLHKRKVKFVRLDGSVPQKQRQTLVNTFQKDPECRLFITTNAGSTGLNLQAADTVINVDLPWNPAVLEQRIARAHRMGQKRPVQVFVLVTEGTLEERLLGTLSAKHELALAVLDPEADADEVAMAGGVDELKRRLEVLLGTVADAPADESQREDQGREAERLAHQERVSTAGGQLLTAAFAFLGELIPPQQETTPSQDFSEGPRQSKAARNGAPPDDREVTRQQEAATAYITSCLADCLTQDEQGRPRLTVTLPDAAALDSFAATLARVVGAAAGRQAG
jgi:SNF2 family DNA or RNA helicase